MQAPISVDSPEGAEALLRMNEELTQAEAGGGAPASPASPPTAPAADVFAGMSSPISVDSPEGAELCRKQEGRYDMAGQCGPSGWLGLGLGLGLGLARVAGWPRLPGALGSLRRALAMRAASGEPAGRRRSQLVLDTGAEAMARIE